MGRLLNTYKMCEKNERFWEVDFVGGIALLMMITYHLIFNPYYFGDYGIDANSGLWLVLGRSTAILFITIAGISLSLSYARVKGELSTKGIIVKYVKRGGFIFSIGLLVSLGTYIFLRGEGYVVFGILHFIGLSVIIAIPLLKYRYISLVVGAISIALGFFLAQLEFGFYWLLWLGFRPISFQTMDYFPIFPWFGLVALGIFTGRLICPEHTRKVKIPSPKNGVVRYISLTGQNTLLIYLVHQPVLIALLYALGLIEIPLL